jgi:hypothetical protein
MLVCWALVMGACQTVGDPPPEITETAQELVDCTPGGNFCTTPPAQFAVWQGQVPPLAGPGQSYHAYQDPTNQAEMILALADINQGKIVWGVHIKGASSQQTLLGVTWGRGPVDVVRPPPPPPPPVGTERYIMERALRFQQLHAEALQATQACGP